VAVRRELQPFLERPHGVTVTSAMAVHPSSSALVRPGDHGPVVVLAGDIDLEAVAEVRLSIGEALARGADPLVFDLRDVAFLDSSGLSVLLNASQHADVVLRSVPDRVHALLDTSAVAERFRLED
jgi:anti-anti-sigma factor